MPYSGVSTLAIMKDNIVGNTVRIDIRIDAETKKLAEQAALLSGSTVTQYLVHLIRENAPKVIE